MKNHSRLPILFALAFCFSPLAGLQAQHETITAEIDSLLTLASAAQKERRLPEAHDLAAAAKEKCERSIGTMTPQYAMSLHTMGVYLLNSGQLDKALPLTLEALEIRRQVFGNQHEDYGKTLNNLVIIYFDLGLYEKAKPLAEESLAIKERVYGTDHPDITSALINLGKVLFGLYDYQKSIELLERALAIREKQLGHDHPKSLTILQLLAADYTMLPDGEKAVAYNERALAVTEKILQGKPDQTYPMILGNLAVAYSVNKQYDKELALQPRIDSLLDLALPRTHPSWTLRYNSWMQAYRHNGMIKEAVGMALKTQEANTLQTLDKAAWMPGEDLYEQIQQNNNMIHQVFSLAADHAADYAAFAQSCYDDALLYKGMGLSSQRFLERKLSGENAAAKQDVQDWKALRKSLSDAFANAKTPPDELASLKNKAALLESRLMAEVGGFREMQQNPTWQDVRAALRPGEAAVEFLRFTYFKPEEITARDVRYLALVLRPGDAAPKVVSVCFEKELLPLLPPDSLRTEQPLHDLYHGIAKNEEGRSLSDLLWSPLESSLRGVQTIYFSPVGQLNRLSMAALAPDGKTPLTARIKFHQLLSTRSLAKPQKVIAPNDALLLGGIRYDADSSELKAAHGVLATEGSIGFSENTNSSRGAESRGTGKWRYLRGSEKEVNNIQKTLQKSGFTAVEKRMGAQACEELFLPWLHGKAAPGILHIATHGFALASKKEQAAGQLVNAPQNAFSASGNPMNRTGLILAGGDHAWQTGNAFEGLADGILTAYEISQLDCSRTELVVLSACESGLGEVRGAEGVLGLQRAFKIAGAHYLLTSLWQVPDQETQELMTLFYRKWMEEKMPVPEAFRAAQGETRRLYPSPYYWAGFVLTE